MNSDSASASLNVDIMHTIMSYATRNIVSDIMKSCRTLNSEGAKYLLKGGVSVGCEAELVSFKYFLTARGNVDDSLRRLSLFKSFSLDFDTPSPDVAGLLADFFEKIAPAALNFTSLEIRPAEALLTSYPPLGAAIAKLTKLEALRLSFCGEHCAQLLRTLQSKLITANVTFGDDEREDEEIPELDRNPILLLQGSESTLKSLSTSFAAVSSSYGPCYTNVTELSLSFMDLPKVTDYMRAFPNLVSLSVFECSGYEDDPDIWEDRRDISLLYQAQSGTWRSLRYYGGSVLTLWTFGLMCRIPSIELDFNDHELDVEKLIDILHDVRPSRLVLKLPGASCLLDEEFRSALRVDDLRVLDLRVTFNSRDDSTLHAEDVQDAFVDVVRATSARIVKLTLIWSFFEGLRRRPRGEESPPMPFEVYLRDMDVDAYADILFASTASLKKLQVSVVGPKRRTRKAERRRPQPATR